MFLCVKEIQSKWSNTDKTHQGTLEKTGEKLLLFCASRTPLIQTAAPPQPHVSSRKEEGGKAQGLSPVLHTLLTETFQNSITIFISREAGEHSFIVGYITAPNNVGILFVYQLELSSCKHRQCGWVRGFP